MTGPQIVRRQLGSAVKQHPRSSCYASRAAAILQLDQGDWMYLRREELERLIQRQDSEERMIDESASEITRQASQEPRSSKPLAGLAVLKSAGKMLATVFRIKSVGVNTESL
ncbi:hypothetical protein DOTSEDRAFT_70912 [Dothistroma septosporum NZE10]|uniref:Uncharacterized protein n=1 Tax=Dothistroma septosporum (strain NZE10 / CBS 128990) TaxID=675120 RepID=N1PNP1_DOTSN|nr:hypothetical protein DOTSEDRAFT_70912 [Dothistroma septosporum NZE10]